MIEITLNFDGYYTDNYNFPTNPGIYCIYEIKYGNSQAKLIYIGQAQRGRNGDLKTRIQNHGSTDYKNTSKVNYKYSFVDLSDFPEQGIDLTEAALVFRMQPEKNDQLKKVYNYDDAKVTIKGKNQGLAKEFTLTKGITREEYFGL